MCPTRGRGEDSVETEKSEKSEKRTKSKTREGRMWLRNLDISGKSEKTTWPGEELGDNSETQKSGKSEKLTKSETNKIWEVFTNWRTGSMHPDCPTINNPKVSQTGSTRGSRDTWSLGELLVGSVLSTSGAWMSTRRDVKAAPEEHWPKIVSICWCCRTKDKSLSLRFWPRSWFNNLTHWGTPFDPLMIHPWVVSCTTQPNITASFSVWVSHINGLTRRTRTSTRRIQLQAAKQTSSLSGCWNQWCMFTHTPQTHELRKGY